MCFPRAAAELLWAFERPVTLEARHMILRQTNPTGRFRLAVVVSRACPHVDATVDWCDFQAAFSATIVTSALVATTSKGAFEASGGYSPRHDHDERLCDYRMWLCECELCGSVGDERERRELKQKVV